MRVVAEAPAPRPPVVGLSQTPTGVVAVAIVRARKPGSEEEPVVPVVVVVPPLTAIPIGTFPGPAAGTHSSHMAWPHMAWPHMAWSPHACGARGARGGKRRA